MSEIFKEHPQTSLNKIPDKTFRPVNAKATANSKHKPLLSIIVPVYNEEQTIESCYKRLNAVADTLTMETEIIFVNDGSNDNTLELLYNWHQQDKRISIIDLSRNFGKEIAMTAGLDHAGGDAVVIIDADLQDPPELIPQMIAEWQRGYDIVYMKRANRQGETRLKKITAYGFYYLINKISHIDMPQGAGDFRLLSRRAVNSLCQLRESSRFMKGLFSWLGFKQKEIIYQRDERASGASKWSYMALWRLALDGITSFSTAPLKLASYLGLACIAISMLVSVWMSIDFFAFHEAPSSMSLLATGLLIFAGVQMILLGVIGEYLGRMYMETKKRPLYLINDWQQSSASEQNIHPSDNLQRERHIQ